MGQSFASHLGVQRVVSRGCTHSYNGSGFLLLALSLYNGDPYVIDHWPRPRLPTKGSFTRLLCEKPAVITLALPGSIPLLAGPPPPRNTVTGWSPGQVSWGGGGDLWRPCIFTQIHSLTGPVGQPFASRLGGQRFASRGCTHSHN